MPNILTRANLLEEQGKILLARIKREKQLARRGRLLKTHQGLTKHHKDFFFL